MKELFRELRAYLDFICTQQALCVSIHDRKGFTGAYLNLLLPYTIHSSPYCMQMKQSPARWRACRLMQAYLDRRCQAGKNFSGCCYGGVEERVLPVVMGGEVIAFVCVSGYRNGRGAAILEKRKKDRDWEVLREKYYACLEEVPVSWELAEAALMPVVRMLQLIYLGSDQKRPQSGTTEQDYVYSHIAAFLRQHFRERITLKEICAFCHYSPSYVSHLFKKKSGCGIAAYVNRLRIEEARRLLEETDWKIREIAFDVGFEDSNYFSNLFRARYGMGPREYRKQVVGEFL